MLDLWPDFDPSWIVYEDDDLIAIDKPAGVPSQAAEAEHDDDVVARLRRFLAARRGVAPEQVYLGVHQRLDRDTSGVMLYALRREANPALAAQFEARSVDKTYIAAASGVRDGAGERILRDRLARGRDGRMQVVTGARGRDTREAITRVRVLRREGERALLELGCDTGRTHQLRVQLAHSGTPIAGDRLYGGGPALRLLLHAARLQLRAPGDGRQLDLRAVVPLEIEDWLVRGAIDAATDRALFQRALGVAIQARYRLGRSLQGDAPTTAFRLFHGAAEGAPEIAVDLYGDFLVVHLAAELSDPRERDVLDALAALGPTGIHVKRHARQKNELGDAQDAWAPASAARGTTAPEEMVVYEHGLPFGVRLAAGLRTGLFLDQRDNRRRIRELARGKRLLNLFAYTGGFSLAALAGGAEHATCVDASAAALAWAQRNVARIGASERHRVFHADAFDALAQFARRGERFDLIVIDPPSYATTRKRRFVALKHYGELCAAALRVLAPGGSVLACINHHAARQSKLRRDVAHAAESCARAIVALKDLPAQIDFPAAIGAAPLGKSVLLTCD